MPIMVRFLLELLEEVTGLKVYYNKSPLVGVNVEESVMERAAIVLNHRIGRFPITYLGLPLSLGVLRAANWWPRGFRLSDAEFFWHGSGDRLRDPEFSVSQAIDYSLLGCVGTHLWEGSAIDGDYSSSEHAFPSSIVFTDSEGQWIWHWEKDGCFSVRLAYSIISDGGIPHRLHWKPKSPLRGASLDVEIIYWLHRFLLDIQTTCALYGLKDDSIDHIFTSEIGQKQKVQASIYKRRRKEMAVTYEPLVINNHVRFGYLATSIVFGDFSVIVGSPFFLGVIPTIQDNDARGPPTNKSTKKASRSFGHLKTHPDVVTGGIKTPSKFVEAKGDKPRPAQVQNYSVRVISSEVIVDVPSQHRQYKNHKSKRLFAATSRLGKSMMIRSLREWLNGSRPVTPHDKHVPIIPTLNHFSLLRWLREKQEDPKAEAGIKQKIRQSAKVKQIWVPKEEAQKIKKTQATALMQIMLLMGILHLQISYLHRRNIEGGRESIGTAIGVTSSTTGRRWLKGKYREDLRFAGPNRRQSWDRLVWVPVEHAAAVPEGTNQKGSSEWTRSCRVRFRPLPVELSGDDTPACKSCPGCSGCSPVSQKEERGKTGRSKGRGGFVFAYVGARAERDNTAVPPEEDLSAARSRATRLAKYPNYPFTVQNLLLAGVACCFAGDGWSAPKPVAKTCCFALPAPKVVAGAFLAADQHCCYSNRISKDIPCMNLINSKLKVRVYFRINIIIFCFIDKVEVEVIALLTSDKELLELLLRAVVVAPAITSLSVHVATVTATLKMNIADTSSMLKRENTSLDGCRIFVRNTCNFTLQ
ncbi:hypothetical protein Taro_000752 [Colocasia esculenta]|uniref:Uncharacterized protein n=1 Tax=Colocasia esculenta TaxID=4460 RepID=A0A843TIP1_COLES|nr:hypothetical protein [Colocasia esculenta]